jgi:hypothetical protein
MSKEIEDKKNPPGLNWIATPFFGTAAAMLIIGTLYFAGERYYINYLSYFGINDKGFPLEKNVYLSQAVIIILDSPFAKCAITVILIILGLMILYIYVHATAPIFGIKIDCAKINKYRIINSIVKKCLLPVFYITILVLIIGSLYLIYFAGQYGISAAIEDENCFNEYPHSKCRGNQFIYSLVRDDDSSAKQNPLLFSGFLVIQTKARVALYCGHKVVEYELTGRHLEIERSIKEEDKNGNFPKNDPVACLGAVIAPLEKNSQPSPQS